TSSFVDGLVAGPRPRRRMSAGSRPSAVQASADQIPGPRGRSMHRWILAGLLVLAAFGVAFAQDLPLDTINAFRPGQATRADVVRGLGPPLHEDRAADGRTSLVYRYFPRSSGLAKD